MPPTNLMMDKLKENTLFIRESSFYIYFLLSFIFVGAFWAIVRRVRDISVYCYSPIYVLPLELIEKNSEVVFALSKIIQGGRSIF